MSSTSILRATAQIASAVKEKNPERERAGRIDLAEAKIEREIRESLSTAPSMPLDRRQRLAALLLNGGE